MNLIDHLPRDSRYVAAVLDDEDTARALLDNDDGDKRRRTPSLTEFGPKEELLAAVFDRLGEIVQVLYAVNGSKRPPKLKPWPRPRTAVDRERDRRGEQSMREIVAIFAPHEVNGSRQ